MKNEVESYSLSPRPTARAAVSPVAGTPPSASPRRPRLVTTSSSSGSGHGDPANVETGSQK
eukprot:3584404-Prymnesium_polylepis.1